MNESPQCPACRRSIAPPAVCAGCDALTVPRTLGWREAGERPFASVAAARDEALAAVAARAS